MLVKTLKRFVIGPTRPYFGEKIGGTFEGSFGGSRSIETGDLTHG